MDNQCFTENMSIINDTLKELVRNLQVISAKLANIESILSQEYGMDPQ